LPTIFSQAHGDPEETLQQLISVLDNRELYDALVDLLKAEGKDPTLAPI
jgi:hypothetical protein